MYFRVCSIRESSLNLLVWWVKRFSAMPMCARSSGWTYTLLCPHISTTSTIQHITMVKHHTQQPSTSKDNCHEWSIHGIILYTAFTNDLIFIKKVQHGHRTLRFHILYCHALESNKECSETITARHIPEDDHTQPKHVVNTYRTSTRW